MRAALTSCTFDLTFSHGQQPSVRDLDELCEYIAVMRRWAMRREAGVSRAEAIRLIRETVER